jgi:AcrR family transcriptional regulator
MAWQRRQPFDHIGDERFSVATRGRRPGTGDTRQAILDAARRAFADSGFDRARLRSIADEAGVDPSLIVHFFGSKRELYEAAISAPPAPVLEESVSTGAGNSSLVLLCDVLEYLDRPDVHDAFIAEVRSALTTPDLDAILDRFVFLPLNAQLFDAITGEGAQLRQELVRAQVTGVVMARYVYPHEPLSAMDAREIATALAPSVDHYLGAVETAQRQDA